MDVVQCETPTPQFFAGTLTEGYHTADLCRAAVHYWTDGEIKVPLDREAD